MQHVGRAMERRVRHRAGLAFIKKSLHQITTDRHRVLVNILIRILIDILIDISIDILIRILISILIGIHLWWQALISTWRGRQRLFSYIEKKNQRHTERYDAGIRTLGYIVARQMRGDLWNVVNLWSHAVLVRAKHQNQLTRVNNDVEADRKQKAATAMANISTRFKKLHYGSLMQEWRYAAKTASLRCSIPPSLY